MLGFNSKDDVFYENEFRALGADVHIATADGTYGIKGFVTDVIKDMQYTFFYTCGPEPMFRAMHKIMKTPGQYSFEERMGCGFGACMGCSCKTHHGQQEDLQRGSRTGKRGDNMGRLSVNLCGDRARQSRYPGIGHLRLRIRIC